MLHRRRLGVTARNIERRFKRNVQACSCTGVHFSGKTVEWATPQDFFDKLDLEFHFTVDLCATPEKCAAFFSRADNGLAQTWTGTCWLQPSLRATDWSLARKSA
jgi:DNA N-6-adenine-methyltransferase (Dam)